MLFFRADINIALCNSFFLPLLKLKRRRIFLFPCSLFPPCSLSFFIRLPRIHFVPLQKVSIKEVTRYDEKCLVAVARVALQMCITRGTRLSLSLSLRVHGKCTPAMHTERPLYSSMRYTLRVHVYHVLYAVGCRPMASGTRAMLFDYRALGVARSAPYSAKQRTRRTTRNHYRENKLVSKVAVLASPM